MAEPHGVINELDVDDARRTLGRCCGSSRWIEAMLARRPFASTASLHAEAEAIWSTLGREDFLEAFAHHPRIGAGTGADEPVVEREAAGGDGAGEALRATAAWSREEQARVAEAEDGVLRALRAANVAYARRFGYIFIVCAHGKTAAEMLALLESRLAHDPARELAVAASEQARITRLRLDRVGA